MTSATLYNHADASATRARWRTYIRVYLLFVSGFARLYRRVSANLASPLRIRSLQFATRPLWKSWIAMLCVALIAFVTLEQVSPAHAAIDPCNVVSMTDTTDGSSFERVVADADQEDEGSSRDSQQQQQRHHCCGAHTSGTPPLANAGTPLQLAEMLVPARSNDAARDRAPSGLERPPKVTAIV